MCAKDKMEDKFKLTAPFGLSGDQPQAVEKLVRGFLEKDETHQTLLGVTGSGKTFTMANVIARLNRPTLVLAHNKTLAAQLYSEFKEFFPENSVNYFVSYYDYYQPEAYIPASDVYIEKDASVNERIEKLRLMTTKALLERRDVVVVASVSCIYGLGKRKNYEDAIFRFACGERWERRDFMLKLLANYYERNDMTLVPGTFRSRGETMEIFPSYSDTALRIYFFDDEIERMGVTRSRRAMEQADLVLAVIDGHREITCEDLELIKCAERAPHGIVILSKRDLGSLSKMPETTLPVIEISSVTGEGLDKLEATVRALFPMPAAPAGEILTNARQFDAVSRALESMKAAGDAMRSGCTPDIVLTETETAMAALGELTGRTVREEVTNRIFERFCVGK